LLSLPKKAFRQAERDAKRPAPFAPPQQQASLQPQLLLHPQPHPQLLLQPQPQPHPQLLLQPQPHPLPQPQLEPQLLPPQLFPLPQPQQQNRMMMRTIHRQPLSFPLLKHIFSHLSWT